MDCKGGLTMHMSDALVSAPVGLGFTAVSAALLAGAAWQARRGGNEEPGDAVRTGLFAAFVFAGQMINFTIPGTGSSGHLCGGLLLAVLLGPARAFIALASILFIQATLFADGGLLALGCNLFNLGFFSILVAYPFVYRPLARRGGKWRSAAAILASIVGLLGGAFGVVMQTTASGIASLPFGIFLATMLGIHLAIGIGEGLITASVLNWLERAKPELLQPPEQGNFRFSFAPALLVLSFFVAGLVSAFASTHPDGLEWSVLRVSGVWEAAAPGDGLHGQAASLQEKTAVFPDYQPAGSPEGEEHWPALSAGGSIAGLAGTLATLLLAGMLGLIVQRKCEGLPCAPQGPGTPGPAV